MNHLISALEAIEKIGEDGVIERRETGKPTWSALEAVKDIAREAIAKHSSGNAGCDKCGMNDRTEGSNFCSHCGTLTTTMLIIDADVVQRIVDEDRTWMRGT